MNRIIVKWLALLGVCFLIGVMIGKVKPVKIVDLNTPAIAEEKVNEIKEIKFYTIYDDKKMQIRKGCIEGYEWLYIENKSSFPIFHFKQVYFHDNGNNIPKSCE